ncbi:MAG TPA: hypothetical protein VN632_03305 [Stellaceae bacterium]|nr:hypothetical protein [Stellaceae bacterium]
MASNFSTSSHDQRQLSLGLWHREASAVGRVVAAVILGLVLLLLSAIINIAKGASGSEWAPMWISWVVACVIVAAIAVGASTLRVVWGALFFVCFLAGVILAASLPWYSRAAESVPQSSAELAQSLGLSPPVGAAVGGAIVSGAMGIAAVIVTVVFLAASYFLLYHRRHRHA